MSQTPTAAPSATDQSARTTRVLTLGALAVTAVATVTVGSVLVSSGSSNVQGVELDLAGQQQLFTERIADSVAELRADPKNEPARAELASSSDALREIRLGLKRGDAALDLDGIVPAEFSAFYSPAGSDLDARMSRYERAGADIAAAPGPVNAAAAAMIEAEALDNRLVTDIGLAVNSLASAQQAQATDQAQRARFGVLAMGVLGLVSLGASVSVMRRRRSAQAELDTTFSGTRRFVEAQSAALAREQAAVAELVELDRTRSLFVSNISHELRMPLTSMVGYLEILGDEEAGKLNDKQHEMIDTAIRNGQRLGRLVDDLLMLSLGELDGSATSRELVDLGALAADIADILAPRAAEARVGLSAFNDGQVHVRGDRRQLEQVMFHVVGTSMKLTPCDGAIDIEVGLDPVDSSKAQINVVDAVTGEAREQLEGTDVGLTIAERFIQAHDGQIETTSVPGEATIVSITLPAVAVDGDGSALGAVAWPIGSRFRDSGSDVALTTENTNPSVAAGDVVTS